MISGDVAANIRNTKDATDGAISMSGSATLVRWLLATGLLDELKLLVHPIAVGHGRRFFEDGHTHLLQLAKQETLQPESSTSPTSPRQRKGRTAAGR